MVHQEIVGDDGSHRLLWLPCVVVVLVMVMLVTACSPADGETGGGVKAAGAGQDEGPAGDEELSGDGVIAVPEVTVDGRMIQPAGHTGLWFETEPTDPLEKLVYDSQRFVGQPVVLEPLGERAGLPEWEDLPDPCHPEVIMRMGELKLVPLEGGEAAQGLAYCAFYGEIEDEYGDIVSSLWGTWDERESFVGDYSLQRVTDLEYEFLDRGELADNIGCISVSPEPVRGFFIWSGAGELGDLDGCLGSNNMLQVYLNVVGGSLGV
ncbi:hypothetical protein ACT3SZ_04705 [Corynebacterium sp. AOP40-9SA-29]|uniref:hypothetical protein n=1 Tax=Corynebacterium sp. AOP40-9SA-29 TaxID=3457677 RepID=UPI0040342AF3